MNLVKLIAMLKGRKTYAVAILMILNGLYAYLMGEVPTYDNPNPVASEEGMRQILEGIAFFTTRAGISKATGS